VLTFKPYSKELYYFYLLVGGIFILLGTIANALAIIVGSIFGLLVKNGLSEKLSNTVMNGLSLCIIYIGFSGTLKGDNPLLIIISIGVGAVIGELIDIDKWLNRFGKFIERKLKKEGSTSQISEGFVTATLVYCIGAMAIVGSLESGIQGKHDILFAKSIIDGITAIIFSSTLGIGVALSAVSVFLYQGAITLSAYYVKVILTEMAINNMTAVGSLLIIGLGFNMLGVTKIKVANLLPAIIIPVIYSLFL